MGFFSRRREQATANPVVVTAHLHTGDQDLEVVGESHYQASLWHICGRTPGTDRVRHDVNAVLVPEPTNPQDEKAIAVHVEGHIVGYLGRADAAMYLDGLHTAMHRCSGYVALRGVIVGGGIREDGPGLLGIWLQHDPGDFGLSVGRAGYAGLPGRPGESGGTMRTGFSEAWLTDADDDSYDLSWFNDLPDADRPAIAMLRQLLAVDPDPIDRHFQFAELESRLYRSRDLYDEALDEFDDACRQHDMEMQPICAAFMAKWSKIPLLETYRQMAIRQQKVKDWDAVVWWTSRGLDLYGSTPVREEAVEDLIKRRNRAVAKLEAPQKGPSPPSTATLSTTVATHLAGPRASREPTAQLEILICTRCEAAFERIRVRGRKPSLCPPCRGTS